MRLIVEGARRRWIVDFQREDRREQRVESQADAMVERSHPDDVPSRAEMDARRVGFGQ